MRPLLCAPLHGKLADVATHCGNNSVVECDLAKVDVAGSNPVSRSKKARSIFRSGFFRLGGSPTFSGFLAGQTQSRLRSGS